ncbi:MAG: hypothetical protein JRI49_04700, partial [Deltaproteobacteria bacterium]|nr:hypothetical protein [Deltaproteobacteria bacterium]
MSSVETFGKYFKKNKRTATLVSVLIITIGVFTVSWIATPQGVNDFFVSLGSGELTIVGTDLGKPGAESTGKVKDLIGDLIGDLTDPDALNDCKKEMCEHLAVNSSLLTGHRFNRFAKIDATSKEDCNEFVQIMNTECDQIALSNDQNGYNPTNMIYSKTLKEVMSGCSDPEKAPTLFETAPDICIRGNLDQDGKFIKEGVDYAVCLDEDLKPLYSYKIRDYC